jgi:hypothetical protein
MKDLLIQDKGNKHFKLTVTPTEERIKLRADTTRELSDAVVSFLTTVASKPEMVNCNQAFRGKFNPKDINDPNTYRITMYTNGKSDKHSITY